MLFKYNFSDSKKGLRCFWFSDQLNEIRWGKKQLTKGYSKVDLSECVGVVYGPYSNTFSRAELSEHDYHCLSLVFNDRTLDVTATTDIQLRIWYLGLVTAASKVGTVNPMLRDIPLFAFKLARMKLTQTAHSYFVTLRTFLYYRIRSVAKSAGLDTHQVPGRGRKKTETHTQQSTHTQGPSVGFNLPHTHTHTHDDDDEDYYNFSLWNVNDDGTYIPPGATKNSNVSTKKKKKKKKKRS
eukprot:GHVR01116275.1.p1 GENE.GHVR01116275.1~~GHVR01116275.1.p1  ORF type:complete len:239 (+),score=77.70 GHVR01116275.1:577-1293(+)